MANPGCRADRSCSAGNRPYGRANGPSGRGASPVFRLDDTPGSLTLADRSGMRALLLVLLLVAPAHAVIVGGGGSHATDCLLVFEADANWPSDPDRTPKEIRCVDGDPCDLDGTVNG